jgi:hypothetical protein
LRIKKTIRSLRRRTDAEALLAQLEAEIVQWPVTLSAEQLAKARLGVRANVE